MYPGISSQSWKQLERCCVESACEMIVSNRSQSPVGRCLLQLPLGCENKSTIQARSCLWCEQGSPDDLFTGVAQWLPFCRIFLDLSCSFHFPVNAVRVQFKKDGRVPQLFHALVHRWMRIELRISTLLLFLVFEKMASTVFFGLHEKWRYPIGLSCFDDSQLENFGNFVVLQLVNFRSSLTGSGKNVPPVSGWQLNCLPAYLNPSQMALSPSLKILEDWNKIGGFLFIAVWYSHPVLSITPSVRK